MVKHYIFGPCKTSSYTDITILVLNYNVLYGIYYIYNILYNHTEIGYHH